MMRSIDITIRGMVQGIGFRPFVAELAEKLHIKGWVRNSNGIVTVHAEQDPDVLDQFAMRLQSEAPSGSVITRIEIRETEIREKEIQETENPGEEKHDMEGCLAADFRIIHSNISEEERQTPLIPADLPTCDRCKAELHDPENRRYRHPFISCTACGPRYSILDAIPYDRDTIVMKDFPMCPDCSREYTQRGNVRRHAQTICCPDCGPQIEFTGFAVENKDTADAKKDKKIQVQPQVHIQGDTRGASWNCIAKAAECLKLGGIVAIKDIGGYHLAASPFDDRTVALLRHMKHREKKPFAVMFADEEQAALYCCINEEERRLLLSSPRPIVLLRNRWFKETLGQAAPIPAKRLSADVCGTSPDIGAMLPCNPLQILLTELCGPLIMTSANTSGDLLTLENEAMQKWLEQGIAETVSQPEYRADEEIINRLNHTGLLSHNRPIRTPLDDSILRVVRGKTQTFRRARGFVPDPIPFTDTGSRIFAAGGDLKSVFAYVQDGKAYLSQHLGDLEEISSLKQYGIEKKRMQDLFSFTPDLCVCDMHPGYYSANIQAKASWPILRVQHHQAHVASVIAEHGLTGPVLGFAFDGTGYGTDGTIWGSEVFRVNDRPAEDSGEITGAAETAGTMQRLSHLKPVTLTGGDEGARDCDMILYGYLHSFVPEIREKITSVLETDPNAGFQKDRCQITGIILDRKFNCITSTSMGRLFDAVSAFLGICHYNSYEGEAPVELENLAATTCKAVSLPVTLENTGTEILWNTESLFLAMARAMESETPKAEIARGFLMAVAEYIKCVCRHYQNISEKPFAVVLSGGTFLNRILLEKITDTLAEEGIPMYRNEQVPPGDGGLCLGQAWLASRK